MKEEDYTIDMYNADEIAAWQELESRHLEFNDMLWLVKKSFRPRLLELVARKNNCPICAPITHE